MQTKTSTDTLDLGVQEPKPAHLPAAPRRARQPAAEPAPAISTTPMELLRIVTERGASVEEIGKFMDLMERQQDREAKQSYMKAITAFKKTVQTIYKDEKAEFEAKNRESGAKVPVEYDYATLGHICEQIINQMAEYGLSHRWDPQQPPNSMVVVTCILSHEQGHSECATVQFPPDPTGTKNALQAVGSSMTYGERYSLLAVCGIAVKSQGDDDGRAAGTPKTESSSAKRTDTSTPKDGKHKIENADLERALVSIQRKDYSYDELVGYYALSDVQLVRTKKVLGMTEGAQ